jgi:benzoate membrane transport protein
LFRLSFISAALVGALVGFGGTVAINLQAARALGATPEQMASWTFAVSIGIAIVAIGMNLWKRIPVMIAWSTPGAALIATTEGITFEQGIGAFMLAGLLIMITALFKPLETLVTRIPSSVASAMLGGVLISFVMKGFIAANTAPWLVLPLIALFIVARLFNPIAAPLAVIAGGFALSFALGLTGPMPHFGLTPVLLVMPQFDLQVLIGLGVPLYLVTMASQNLPGFAVQKSHGYTPQTRDQLLATGLASTLIAPMGGHTINMSAIVAAICMNKDVHPDPAERWKAGVWYGLIYVLLALFAGSLIALFDAMPKEFIATVAGLALVGSLMGALTQAVAVEKERFAAIFAFGIAASGLSFAGIGAAFWALVGGLTVLGLDWAKQRLAAGDP